MNINKYSTKDQIIDYIKLLNKYKGVRYSQLKEAIYSQSEDIENLTCKPNDKGALGKKVEQELFGNKPNNSPEPDLSCGLDVKVTRFKEIKKSNGDFSAKERLTLTNIGNINKLDYLTEVDRIEDAKFFPKMRHFVLLVFDSNTILEDAIFLGAVIFDYTTIPLEDQEQLCDDFRDIQMKIKTDSVTQRGQKYLHIHKHGSNTRAVGFTSKFVTKLFSHYNNHDLIVKGCSWRVNLQHN
jgi:hypothetical protein